MRGGEVRGGGRDELFVPRAAERLDHLGLCRGGEEVFAFPTRTQLPADLGEEADMGIIILMGA